MITVVLKLVLLIIFYTMVARRYANRNAEELALANDGVNHLFGRTDFFRY